MVMMRQGASGLIWTSPVSSPTFFCGGVGEVRIAVGSRRHGLRRRGLWRLQIAVGFGPRDVWLLQVAVEGLALHRLQMLHPTESLFERQSCRR